MKDLIFIGGAKGVGKTTLLNEINKIYPITIVNTGKIFLRAKNKELNPEKEIYKFLAGDYIGIVDTHFAGSSNNGFVRGISRDYLLALNKSKSIEVILIEADTDSVLDRRLNDTSRKRICVPDYITGELEKNRHYFQEYCKDLSIQGTVVRNGNFDVSVIELMEVLKSGED